MEGAGIIRGYTVDIDPASIGFTDTVIVHVTLESHSEETLYEFGRALAQIPEVLEAFWSRAITITTYASRYAIRAITSGCCTNVSIAFRASGTASPASCCAA